MARPFDPIAIFAVLAEHEVEYVLVGGMAGVIRGSTAMTNDADIVPAPTTANLDRLSRALTDLEARLRTADDPAGIAFDPHPVLLRSVATLNMTTRHGDVDLTFTPAALDDYEALHGAGDVYEIEGHRVRVASLDDIIRSKQAAGRPKDLATLPILLALRDEIERGRA